MPEADAGEHNKRGKRNLQQVVYVGNTIPDDLAEALVVQLLDDLPLVLSNDCNLVLEEDTDFPGEDIASFRVPNLEAALLRMHQHPTASSFTFIHPSSDSKFAGFVFLKGSSASEKRSKQAGMVSGFLKRIPPLKTVAIQCQEMAAAMAVKETSPGQEAAAAEAATKPAAQAHVAITDEQLDTLVKVAHGVKKAKPELVEEYIAACPGVSKNRAYRIFAQVRPQASVSPIPTPFPLSAPLDSRGACTDPCGSRRRWPRSTAGGRSPKRRSPSIL